MRDRLIELIEVARSEYYDYSDEMHEIGMSVEESSAEYIADYLIANGVIFEKDAIEVLRLTTEKIAEKLYDNINKIEHPIGKIVVPLVIKDLIIPAVDKAREEAEQALKGGVKE